MLSRLSKELIYSLLNRKFTSLMYDRRRKKISNEIRSRIHTEIKRDI